MKTRLAAAAVALWVASAVASHSFATVVYEPFDYNPGQLAGNTNPTAPASTNGFTDTNKWTISGSLTNDPSVVAGNLSYPNLPAGVGNMGQLTGHNGTSLTADRIAVPDYTAGQTIYFSMLVRVPSGVTDFGSSTTTGSFFTGFNYFPDTIGNMGSGTQSSGSPLVVRADPAGGGYDVGIAWRDAPAATARIFAPTKLLAGDTHLLVGKYVIGPGTQDDVASLFLDPDLSTGTEPALASAVSADPGGAGNFDYFYDTSGNVQDTTIRSFILRNNSVEPANMQVDEVRIGGSWTDVTTVPEPASLGLLTLAAPFGLARRRRCRAVTGSTR